MKKVGLLISLLITLLLLINIDSLSDYLANFLSDEKKVYISSPNEYKKNYDFKFVQMSNKYVPYSYQGLLNIIFSTLNNGWDTFTFYCPDEYTNCYEDVSKISKNTVLLSNINNFIHPYNNYSKISISNSNTGEVTIKVTKTYSEEDIKKINKGVDEIITNELNNDMSLEDKILIIHDYIINNTRYDVDKLNKDSFNAKGPLFTGKAVCSGYSDLMAIFLTKLGVKNYKVASDSHVWNVMYLNDEWLHIDLTWDDPITLNSDVDTLSHQFYMIKTDKLLEYNTTDHTFDTTIYQELN